MSTPVWCDRPIEIGLPMRSKSEGFGVRLDQKNAPVVKQSRRRGAVQRWGSIELVTTLTATVQYLGGVIKDEPI